MNIDEIMTEIIELSPCIKTENKWTITCYFTSVHENTYTVSNLFFGS